MGYINTINIPILHVRKLRLRLNEIAQSHSFTSGRPSSKSSWCDSKSVPLSIPRVVSPTSSARQDEATSLLPAGMWLQAFRGSPGSGHTSVLQTKNDDQVELRFMETDTADIPGVLWVGLKEHPTHTSPSTAQCRLLKGTVEAEACYESQ